MYTGYFGFQHEGRPAVLIVAGKKSSPLPHPPPFRGSKGDYCWGARTPGTYRLALALLLHALPQPALAIDAHAQFAEEVVALLPSTWSLSKSSIVGWFLSRVRYEVVPGGKTAEGERNGDPG